MIRIVILRNLFFRPMSLRTQFTVATHMGFWPTCTQTIAYNRFIIVTFMRSGDLDTYSRLVSAQVIMFTHLRFYNVFHHFRIIHIFSFLFICNCFPFVFHTILCFHLFFAGMQEKNQIDQWQERSMHLKRQRYPSIWIPPLIETQLVKLLLLASCIVYILWSEIR